MKAELLDPNREAFQMRAQLKRVENCRRQWFDRWSWLLDERKKTLAEFDAIRKEAAAKLPIGVSKKVEDAPKSLKPVPPTTTGMIGWISTKPECQLEIYTSWISRIPIRLPDAWDEKNYHQQKK